MHKYAHTAWQNAVFTMSHRVIHTVLLNFRRLSPTNEILGRKMAFIRNHEWNFL